MKTRTGNVGHLRAAAISSRWLKMHQSKTTSDFFTLLGSKKRIFTHSGFFSHLGGDSIWNAVDPLRCFHARATGGEFCKDQSFHQRSPFSQISIPPKSPLIFPFSPKFSPNFRFPKDFHYPKVSLSHKFQPPPPKV